MKTTTLMLFSGAALALLGLCGCAKTDAGSGDGGTTATAGAGGSTGGTGGALVSGGTGGSTESTTSSSSSTTVAIGPGADCTGDYPIVPIYGDADQILVNFPLVDEGGATLFEDGALACKRVVPPYLPFTVDDWQLTLGVGFGCSLPPDAVSFVAPKAPTFPITIGPESSFAEQSLDGDNPATIPSGVVITDESLAFYACARLSIQDADNRSCISGCRHKGGAIGPDALYSNTTNGLVIPLPVVDLELVSVSPTLDVATKVNNTTLDWNITIHGH